MNNTDDILEPKVTEPIVVEIIDVVEADAGSGDSGFLTAENINTLKHTNDIRLNIVKDAINSDLTKKASGIMAINNLLDSIDGNVHKLAEARLKQTSTKDNSRLTELAIAVLGAKRTGKIDTLEGMVGKGNVPDIATSLPEIELVPFELDINPEPLEIENFVNALTMPKEQ